MSYYSLPKKTITQLELFPCLTHDKINNIPFVSHTLLKYTDICNNLIRETEKRCFIGKDTTNPEPKVIDQMHDITIDRITTIVNQYDYIFKNVPGTELSVSKINTHSVVFYNLMEIFNSFNLFEFLPMNDMKTIIYGKDANVIEEYLNILRENYNDTNNLFTDVINVEKYNELTTDNTILGISSDNIYNNPNSSMLSANRMLFYDLVDNEDDLTDGYVKRFMACVCNIMEYQCENGFSIIRLGNICDKPVLDLMYILTTMFEKIIIYKPNTVSSINNTRYCICKTFITNKQIKKKNESYIAILKNAIRKNMNITSLIKSLPYFFLNKIEESNIILGHQTLEGLNLLNTLLSSKNKNNRLISMTRTNINKCIQWCDKYKIPYNKFTDKVNIFLSTDDRADAIDDRMIHRDDFYYNNDTVLEKNRLCTIDDDVKSCGDGDDLSVVVNALDNDSDDEDGFALLTGISIPYNRHLYLDVVMRSMEENKNNNESL
jgi:hypothetical protein